MRKLSVLVVFAVMVGGCNDVVAPEDLTPGFELDVYVDDQLVASYEGTLARWGWRWVGDDTYDVSIRLQSWGEQPETRLGLELWAVYMDPPLGAGVYPIGDYSYDLRVRDRVPGLFAGEVWTHWLVDSIETVSRHHTTGGSVTVSRIYPDPDRDEHWWIQGEVSLRADYHASGPPEWDEAPNAIRVEGSFTAQHQRGFP